MAVSTATINKVKALINNAAISNGEFATSRQPFWAIDTTSEPSAQILELKLSNSGETSYLTGRVQVADDVLDVYLQLNESQYDSLQSVNKVQGYPISVVVQVYKPTRVPTDSDREYIRENYPSALERLGKSILRADDLRQLSKAQMEAFNKIKGTSFS